MDRVAEIIEAFRQTVDRATAGERFSEAPTDRPPRLDELAEAVTRIEAKLDFLILALAADEEEDEVPVVDLEGVTVGGRRAAGEPL